MNTIHISTVRKVFPAHGTISSEDFNELVDQLVLDFTSIATALNDNVQPVMESLPGGSRSISSDSRTESINPIENGLDGTQLYLDMTTTDINNPLLYNSVQNRPNTILEAMQYLLARIEQLTQDIS
jgi:hypothetical protein